MTGYEDLFQWVIYVFAALFGACIGSFLNVCIYRLPEDLSGVEPGSQDYDGLIDCQIGDQRDTDLPGYLLDLAGTLERQMARAPRVRERLFFVITGEMIESDIENAERAGGA